MSRRKRPWSRSESRPCRRSPTPYNRDTGKVVLRAAHILGAIGPRAKTALPALVQRLDAGDENLRWTILRSISAIDSSGDQAIPVLIERLRDKSEYVRAEAADLLGQRGRAAEASVPELLKTLKDAEPRVRGAAARALPAVGANDKQALPPLVELLGDQAEYYDSSFHAVARYGVAGDAAQALGTYGQADSIPHLIEAVRDPKSRSYRAIEALTAFGPRAKDAVPVLLQLLDEGRLSAAGALVQIGAPVRQVVPQLKERLRSEDERVRIGAALVLCGVDPANTREEPEMVLAALDSNELRHDVAQILGDFGPAADFAVLKLIANLEDKKGWLRWEIATALGKIGPAAKPAGPILIKHLGWSWDYEFIAEAIVGIGPAMVPLLVQELESKPDTTDMRVGLLQALAAFGPQAGSAVPVLVAALA